MRSSTNLLILSLFLVLSLVGIWNHEIWLDESHHWLLARDSDTFADFLRNTRFEGHPILWNILLFIITRFTSDPLWMQVVHVLIASGAIWVFLRNTSFNFWFKLLFVFGYFMFYEFNIISRNYILGVLFLFLACTYYNERKKWIWIALFLALAANTHLMFWVIAVAFAMFIALGHRDIFKSADQKPWLPVSFFVAGLAIAVFQMIPPQGASLYGHLNFELASGKFVSGFVSFFKGLVPVPDFRTVHFWNSNLLVNLSKPISGALSLAVYALPWLLFRKNKNVLIFSYLALIGTQLFFFFTQLSATRYFGMTFVIFILAVWLDHHKTRTDQGTKGTLWKVVVYGILGVQAVAGVIAYSMDLRHSFSSGKEVAAFLQENNLDDRTVITPFCQGTIIASDLQKKVYFLCGESMQSYCNWNADCERGVSNAQIIEKLTHSSLKGNFVFVAKSDLAAPEPLVWQQINDRLRVRWLSTLKPQVVRRVDYSIYEIELADE